MCRFFGAKTYNSLKKHFLDLLCLHQRLLATVEKLLFSISKYLKLHIASMCKSEYQILVEISRNMNSLHFYTQVLITPDA